MRKILLVVWSRVVRLDGARGLRDLGQTKVAVSLRRDEPRWFHVQAKKLERYVPTRVAGLCVPVNTTLSTARLVSAERDGYFG